MNSAKTRIDIPLLPPEAVLEYQQVYKNLHGTNISYEEARSQANDLIILFKAIYRPIQKSWVNQIPKDKVTLDKGDRKSNNLLTGS